MKLLTFLLLGLLTVAGLYGQDCRTMDSYRFFRTIKFGSKVPSGLSAISSKVGNNYYLSRDSLNESSKKKYQDIFRFSGLTFSNLMIGTNKKGQMYSVDLWSGFEFIDSVDLANNKTSDEFSKFTNRLESLFGKASEIKDENDPILNKAIGARRKLSWNWCNRMILNVRLTYGSDNKVLNILSIQLRDRNGDIPEEEKLL